MSRILITPEELEGAAVEFLTASQQTEELIGRLSSIVQDLSSVWEGAAQSAFFQKFDELKPSLEVFIEITEGINNQLNGVADTLRTTDSELSASIRG